MATQPTTGDAPVNGLDMYRESCGGGGVPLIVVHGGFGARSRGGRASWGCVCQHEARWPAVT